MLEPVIAGEIRVVKLFDSCYSLSTDIRSSLVIGSHEQVLTSLLSMTLPTTLANPDLGGTLWKVVVSRDPELAELLSVGLASVDSSKPFPVQPSPLVGICLWAASRIGVSYQLQEMIMAKKTDSTAVYDLFGLGAIVFDRGANGQLAFKDFIPSAGSKAMIESFLVRFAGGSSAAPVMHDDAAAAESVKGSGQAAEKIIESLAPVAKSAPQRKHPESLDTIDEQPVDVVVNDSENEPLDEIDEIDFDSLFQDESDTDVVIVDDSSDSDDSDDSDDAADPVEVLAGVAKSKVVVGIFKRDTAPSSPTFANNALDELDVTLEDEPDDDADDAPFSVDEFVNKLPKQPEEFKHPTLPTDILDGEAIGQLKKATPKAEAATTDPVKINELKVIKIIGQLDAMHLEMFKGMHERIKKFEGAALMQACLNQKIDESLIEKKIRENRAPELRAMLSLTVAEKVQKLQQASTLGA